MPLRHDTVQERAEKQNHPDGDELLRNPRSINRQNSAGGLPSKNLDVSSCPEVT